MPQVSWLSRPEIMQLTRSDQRRFRGHRLVYRGYATRRGVHAARVSRYMRVPISS